MLNTPKLKDSINQYDKKLFVYPSYKNLEFIKDECTDIDQINKNITITNKTINFDYLIIAVGSDNNDFGINGVKENCYFLKNKEDLDKLGYVLKNNKNINITILGAGPTGIELAFELSKTYTNIKIIEAMNKILPSFTKETSTIILDQLKKNNINLLLDNKVTKIEKDKIHTANVIYPTDVSIWTCGIKPNQLVTKLIRTQVLTNNFTVDSNLKFTDSIYAIGDIVASKNHGPPTAQNAVQQGKYLANYFNNNFNGPSYEYKEKGKIIHSKDSMIIETPYGIFNIPNQFKFIVDYFIN